MADTKDGIIRITFDYTSRLKSLRVSLNNFDKKYIDKERKISITVDDTAFKAAEDKLESFAQRISESSSVFQALAEDIQKIERSADSMSSKVADNVQSASDYYNELFSVLEKLEKEQKKLNDMNAANANKSGSYSGSDIKGQKNVVNGLQSVADELFTKMTSVNNITNEFSNEFVSATLKIKNGLKANINEPVQASSDNVLSNIEIFKNAKKEIANLYSDANKIEKNYSSGNNNQIIDSKITELKKLLQERNENLKHIQGAVSESKINTVRVLDSDVKYLEENDSAIKQLMSDINSGIYDTTNQNGTMVENVVGKLDKNTINQILSAMGTIKDNTLDIAVDGKSMTAVIETTEGAVKKVSVAWDDAAKTYRQQSVELITEEEAKRAEYKKTCDEAVKYAQKYSDAQAKLIVEETTGSKNPYTDNSKKIEKQRDVVEKYRLEFLNATKAVETFDSTLSSGNKAVSDSEISNDLTNIANAASVSKEDLSGLGDVVTECSAKFNSLRSEIINGNTSYTSTLNGDLVQANDAAVKLENAFKNINDKLQQGQAVTEQDVADILSLIKQITKFSTDYGNGSYLSKNNSGSITTLSSKSESEIKSYLQTLGEIDQKTLKISSDSNTVTATVKQSSGEIKKVKLEWDSVNDAYREQFSIIKSIADVQEEQRKVNKQNTATEIQSNIKKYKEELVVLREIEKVDIFNGLDFSKDQAHQNQLKVLTQLDTKIQSLVQKYINYGATKEEVLKIEEKYTAAQSSTDKAYQKNINQFDAAKNKLTEYKNAYTEFLQQYAQFSGSDSYKSAEATAYVDKVNELKDILSQLDLIIGQNGIDILSDSEDKQVSEFIKKIQQLIKDLSGNKYLLTNDKGTLTNITNKSTIEAVDYIKNNIGAIVDGTLKTVNATGEVSASVSNIKGEIQEVTMQFDGANNAYRILTKNIDSSSSTFQKLSNRINKSFEYLIDRFSGYQIWTWLTNAMQSGVDAVIELDTALTEMRKVSDESEASLRDLQQSFFDIADTIGTTASDLSDATASFMRIGESAEEATESATQAAILYNVSEFESIDDAADALVAVSQAYQDIEKSQIVDIINELGNNYAIATDDLSEALQTVSSTMSLLGVSLEQTSALITTANETIQDESKVATGLRTIALRIFSTDEGNEELEAMGEDVDEFVTTTVSAKDEIIKAYTAVASNQHKGISIIDEETGTYRNLYDILLDIAEIYEEIQEEDLLYGTNRATALIEELAGKNRSNILSSLLSSPDTLVAALESAENAEGSAEEELSKYLDSIEGKLEILSNSAQEFWSNLISSDFIKFVLDVADDLLGWVIALQDANMLLPSIITLIAGISEAKSGLVSGIASDFLDSKALKTVKNLFSGLASDATNVGDVLANTTSEINNLGTIAIESGDAIGDSFDGIIVAGDDALDSVDSIIVDVDDLRYSTTDLGDAVDDTYDPFIDTLSDTEDTMDGVATASENTASGITKMGNASQTAQIATKSLKAVIAALVTMAVVKTIQWTAAAITAFADAEDDARESVSSANDVINDTADSIDDYKEQIEACLEIINDESSSITESQEAREELLSIQDELIENYGTETQAITAITSAIEGEVDALDKLTQNEYESQKAALINSDQGGFFKNIGHSLSNAVNGYDDDFDRAISTYENGLQDLSKYTISTSSDLYDLVSSIDGVTTSLNTDASAFVSIDDGPLEEQLQAAYDLQEALSSYDGNVPTSITNGLAETIEDLEEAVEAYSSMYELYMEYDSGSPLKSSAYADMYEDLQDAYKAYNEAVIDGDEEAVESAIKAYSEIYDNLTETAINNNDDNVAYYVSTLYEALNQATDEWKFQVDVGANVEFGEDGSGIEDTLDDVFGGFKYSSDAIEYVLNQANAQGSAKEIQDTLIAIMNGYNLNEEQLIDALQELGYVISDEEDILRDTFGQENMDTLTSADLTAALQLTQEEVNACNGDFEKLKDAIKAYREEEYAASIASETLTDAISSISGNLQSQFDALEESYETIFSDDGFSLGSVDQEFMDDVVSQFTDLDEDFEDAFDTDALENWVTVLSDSSSTAADVQNAYDSLANAWLEASGVLDTIDDNTKDYITTALESMGVSNAEEVVESNLIQTKADLKWSDEELASATYDDIKAFAEEEAAIGYVDQAIALLLLRQMALNNEDVDYVSDGNQILAYADSIGLASDTLDEYREALENYKSAQSNGETSLASQYLEQVEELGEELLEEASTWTTPIASYISDGIEQGAATITQTVSKLTNDIEPVFESLAEAYTSIWDEDAGFSLDIDNSVLEGVRSAFDDLDDDIAEAFDTGVLDDFLTVLADATSSSEDVQDAFNALATEYINASGLIDDLNENTVDYVATQLENIGVTNGEEVALALLAQQEAEAIDAAYDFTGKTYDEIQAMGALDGVSTETKYALIQLKIAQILCSENIIDESESIAEVKALAEAAGITIDALTTLAKVQANITALQGELESALANGDSEYASLIYVELDNLESQAADAVDSLNDELSNVGTDIDFDGWTSSFSDAADSTSSDAEDTADNYTDAYEEAKEALQTLRDRDTISEREYLRRLRTLYSQYYADVEEYSEEFFAEQREYLEEYKDYYDSVIEYIIDIYDDAIDKLEDECDDAVDALEKQKDAAHDAYQAQIDAIEDCIDALEAQIDAYDAQIKQLEKQKKAYEDQIEAIEDQIDAYDDMIEELQDQIDAYDDQIEAIEKIQEEYEDEIELLEEKQEALEDVIEEYEDQIDAYEDMIDAYQDQIDAIQDEIDALEDANEERERELALQEALYALEQAKNQKTNLVYSAESGYTYQADDEAIQEAEDALYEAQLDITIAALEKEIDALEDLQDAIQDEIDLIEDQIEAIEAQIEALDDEIEYFQDMIDALDDEIEAIEDLQEELEDQIEAIEDLQDELEDQIELIEDQIDAIEDQIEVIEEYQDALEEQIDAYERQVDDLNEMMDASDDYFDDLIETTEEFYAQQEEELEAWKKEFEELLDIYEEAINLQNLMDLGLTEEDILGMTIEEFAGIASQYTGILADMSSGNAGLQEQLTSLSNVYFPELTGHLTDTNAEFETLSGIDLTNAVNSSQSLRDGLIDAEEAAQLMIAAVGGDASLLVDTEGEAEDLGASGTGASSITSAFAAAKTASDEMSLAATEDFTELSTLEAETAEQFNTDTEEFAAYVSETQTAGLEETNGTFDTIKQSASDTATSIQDDSINPTKESATQALSDVESASDSANADMQGDFDATTKSVDSAISAVKELISELNSIERDITVTIHIVKVGDTSTGETEFTGTVGNAYASGYPGLKRAEENALRSEFGQPELTVYPNGTYELTTEPIISDLPEGTVIFNEDQTERIVKNSGQTGRSFAGGTITELDPSSILLSALRTNFVMPIVESLQSDTFANKIANALANVQTVDMTQEINQTFNITMPNITDSTSADKLMRDLQLISSKKVQYFG